MLSESLNKIFPSLLIVDLPEGYGNTQKCSFLPVINDLP